MTRPFMFALISESRLVRPRDLAAMRFALETNARHCAVAYRKQPPAVEVIDTVANLPDFAQPVVFVDTDTDMDAIAVHYWTPQRGVAARVYVEQTTGMNSGHASLCEATSHEIVEPLVNAELNLWADWHHSPAHPIAQVAVECADPAQDTYVVRSGNTGWNVANFVTPQWFDARYRDVPASAELRFDHAGRLVRQGQIGPEGYVVLRAPAAVGGYLTWLEDARGRVGDDVEGAKRAGKAHAWARTRVRLGR